MSASLDPASASGAPSPQHVYAARMAASSSFRCLEPDLLLRVHVKGGDGALDGVAVPLVARRRQPSCVSWHRRGRARGESRHREPRLARAILMQQHHRHDHKTSGGHRLERLLVPFSRDFHSHQIQHSKIIGTYRNALHISFRDDVYCAPSLDGVLISAAVVAPVDHVVALVQVVVHGELVLGSSTDRRYRSLTPAARTLGSRRRPLRSRQAAGAGKQRARRP